MAMSTPSLVLFSIALVFYLLTCKYILQLVREVNRESTIQSVSIWNWHKGWKVHRTLFPTSSVRMRLLASIVVTVALALVAFCVEARNMVARLQPR
jgi:hypothetical protein